MLKKSLSYKYVTFRMVSNMSVIHLYRLYLYHQKPSIEIAGNPAMEKCPEGSCFIFSLQRGIVC